MARDGPDASRADGADDVRVVDETLHPGTLVADQATEPNGASRSVSFPRPCCDQLCADKVTRNFAICGEVDAVIIA
jgi:hypothetical protein